MVADAIGARFLRCARGPGWRGGCRTMSANTRVGHLRFCFAKCQVLISELLTYSPKSFQYCSFSGGGANLKLSAFCVCNDRFMIWDSTKSERETGRFFLLLISPELQLAWFFVSLGANLK